jgi:hypothetical protein
MDKDWGWAIAFHHDMQVEFAEYSYQNYADAHRAMVAYLNGSVNQGEHSKKEEVSTAIFTGEYSRSRFPSSTQVQTIDDVLREKTAPGYMVTLAQRLGQTIQYHEMRRGWHE